MGHHEIIERLNKAITSLKIFPETIKNFTTILTQIFLSKNLPVQEKEVLRLCGMYSDNSRTLMHFIKELVVQEFLEKAENEEQLEYTQLEADIDEATRENGRLDKFISEGTRALMLETLKNIDNIAVPEDSDLKKFFSWLRGIIELVEADEELAKIIGPLLDNIEKNAILAVGSDYDHETLKGAVKKIKKNAPKMNLVIEENKTALRGIKEILVDLKEGRGTNMNLSEEQEGVTRACKDIEELVKERLAF